MSFLETLKTESYISWREETTVLTSSVSQEVEVPVLLFLPPTFIPKVLHPTVLDAGVDPEPPGTSGLRAESCRPRTMGQ